MSFNFLDFITYDQYIFNVIDHEQWGSPLCSDISYRDMQITQQKIETLEQFPVY